MDQFDALKALAIREPDDVYHAKSNQYVGSHALATFRDSPRLFANQWKGLSVKSDSSAFAFGRAFHTLILEGEDVFRERFAVGGPVNPKTGAEYGTETKAYREWAAEQGRECISTTDYAMLVQMRMGVRRNSASPIGIDAFEPLIECVWRTEIEGVPVQAKIDYFNNQHLILDAKSCRSVRAFDDDAKAYGYAHQLAFYAMVLHACLNDGPFEYDAAMLACEKQEPFRSVLVQVDDEVLRKCVNDNRAALRRMKQCMDEDRWPDNYDGDVQMFSL